MYLTRVYSNYIKQNLTRVCKNMFPRNLVISKFHKSFKIENRISNQNYEKKKQRENG